ncbi:MAG TPA: IS256 family transposase [Bryobacteraceae bacterium]|nr:IS256 family transposase [Bryobacteraceae bacterium]
MAHQPDSSVIETVVQLLCESGLSQMAEAVRIMLNEAMRIERCQVLEAGPYERNERRRGYANGFKPKTLETRLGAMTVQVPQTRGVEFYPSALEKGVRSERALKLAVAEMYVQGVSTRKVTDVMQQLCGLEVSSTQVSRAAQLLDEELTAWRQRPLGEIPYLVLDARYEKVRHGGSVVSCAVLIAVGINPEGHRTLLGVSVSLSEAEVHWREFLAGLQDRGLHGVKLIVSDDHAGLKAAREGRLPGVPWQRCQFHLQQNAGHYVPRVSMRSEVAADLRAIFDAPDRVEADRQLELAMRKYEKTAPKLAAWLATNVPDGLTVFALPPSHRRRLRTSNLLERLNKEIKRRTRVATLFPNEAALLRLVSAVLMEISEEWETEKIYLRMENSGSIAREE